MKNAGNVLKPWTNVKLSLRTPPTLEMEKARQAFKEIFESNPPYDAEIIYEPRMAGSGWNTPTLSKGLKTHLNEASLVNILFFSIYVFCNII